MKRILPIILLSILYVFCINPTTKACSPSKMSFQGLVELYNSDSYIAVEGYFISGTEFRVTRSSSDSIKTGHDYTISEYGPFGSFCQMFEMASRIDTNMLGEQNARLLIGYKDRSKNGKLVTPIFWDEGVDISDNETIVIRDDRRYEVTNEVAYKTSISLDLIRKRLFENDTTSLVWEKHEDRDGYYYDKVLTVSEVQPQFPGGEKEMMKFIHENLQSPVIAAEDVIQERVVARFVVTEDGTIQNIEILRGLSSKWDEEVIRIIESMPKWIPGKHNGRTVKVYHTIPIRIRLQNIE